MIDPLQLRRRAPPADDDASLVAEAAAGSPAAAAALWDRYASSTRRLLVRIMLHDDVEDLLQDTFAAAFRKLLSLRDPQAFRGFVYSIAIHKARSELRYQRVRSFLRLTPAGELPERISPSGIEAGARLRQALGRLNPRARTLFVLRYVEDLELTEVAATLGVSLPTVKRHLAEMRRDLIAGLEQDPLLDQYLAKERAHD